MVFKKLHLLICLTLGFLLPCGAQEVRIDWGSSAIVDKIITSDGSAISLAEFTVELGGFADGFVPTSSNVSQWTSKWRIFDAVTASDTDTNGIGGSSADGYLSESGTDALFAGSAHLQADQTSASEDANGLDAFEIGQQAYVFIRNGEFSNSTDNGVEWLLYTKTGTDGWTYPGASETELNLPEIWSANDADTALWGAINGSQVGAGEFTDGSSDFLLRTHTFVPEPSVAALLLMAAGLAFARKR